MTTTGKKTILDKIDKLHTLGSTNLWDGLKAGMNLLNSAQSSTSTTLTPAFDRLSTLFILTDGMPNVEPPRGHIPMLKSYLDAHPSSFSISTFGFGYSLDSQLLLEIAQVGGGGYGFIPDSGMVGTVFVHAVAAVYACWAVGVKLDVEFELEGEDVEVLGDFIHNKTSWGVQIDAGDLQFGQSRDYVLKFPTWPKTGISASAKLHPFTEAAQIQSNVAKVEVTESTEVMEEEKRTIEFHARRLELVSILFTAASSEQVTRAKSDLESFVASVNTSVLLSVYEPGQALSKDASGQGLIALEPTNWTRWGRHYFPSLARAHQRQMCGNFKDPGLQSYGRNSAVFLEERDGLDAAFDALPPPKPSLRPGSRHTSNMPGGRPSAPLASMARYRKVAGPCFSGSSLVTLGSGDRVRVQELTRGMKVMTLRGSREVAVVVKTAIPSGEVELCKIGVDGLEVTPWHPILYLGEWVFPASLVEPQPQACAAIYSLLLLPSAEDDADAHTVLIGGVWAVTLGHGITSTSHSTTKDVRVHEYLGSHEQILVDLSKMPGFEGDGVVTSTGTRRDKGGRICGFLTERESEDHHGMPGKGLTGVISA